MKWKNRKNNCRAITFLEGKSRDAFSEKFEQIKKEMSLNESKIRKMSDKIKIVARNFQQADDEVVRIVKNGI